MTKREKLLEILSGGWLINNKYPSWCERLADKILELDKEPVCSCTANIDWAIRTQPKDCPIHGHNKFPESKKLEYGSDFERPLSKSDVEYIINIKSCMDAINKLNERINGGKKEEKPSKIKKLDYQIMSRATGEMDGKKIILMETINEIIERINGEEK